MKRGVRIMGWVGLAAMAVVMVLMFMKYQDGQRNIDYIKSAFDVVMVNRR